MKRPPLTAFVLAAQLTFLAGCADERAETPVVASPEAPAATMALGLVSPMTGDGGVVFELRGEGITAVRAAREDLTVFTTRAGEVWKVAVVGPEMIGDLVLFELADVSARDELDVRVIEVADTRNRTRPSLEGYGSEVRLVD